MLRTKVKICGMTHLADARAAVEAGADMLGFIFYEKSPRRCDPGDARRIIETLRAASAARPAGDAAAVDKRPLMVGVFVNETLETMVKQARACGLDAVQLHGHETNEQAQALRREGLTVFKAFRIEGPQSLGAFEAYDVDGYLCDTPDPNLWGGSGRTFDHAALAGASQDRRIILAGGLTADNVAAAVRLVRPWAVDVASGVEAMPGRKDPRKVSAFIEAARQA
mgnify:CR=1 FL=1